MKLYKSWNLIEGSLIAVDGKNDIIIEYDVPMNPSDQHQLSSMVKKVTRKLRLKKFTVPAKFRSENFMYDEKTDTYICPKGQELHPHSKKDAKIYEETDRRFAGNLELYKRRQQIVEHPFGTVKHTMHGGQFLLRTRRKVCGEVALLFLGYNLKRALNVLGFEDLMARLNSLLQRFLRPTGITRINSRFSCISPNILLLFCNSLPSPCFFPMLLHTFT